MQRRQFIAGLGGAAVVTCGSRRALSLAIAVFWTVGIAVHAAAQDQSKLTRIGVVMSGSANTSRDFIDGLKQGLAEVGLV